MFIATLVFATPRQYPQRFAISLDTDFEDAIPLNS